jgi:general secretion pathway protein I
MTAPSHRSGDPPRGFTLIEVLVALIIVALGSAAMLAALANSARAAERIRERALANYVAMNRLSETRLEPEFPADGIREGTEEMGGARWIWRQEISRTPIEGVRQITVSVRSAADATGSSGDSKGWLVTLTGARGAAVSVDPTADRIWDLATRTPP